MERTQLLDFYNELIIKQDYFECHEIMESHWKSKPVLTKHDPEVFLILVAVAEYHYRQGNTAGAERSYSRAIALYDAHEYDLFSLGMTEILITMIHERKKHIKTIPFTPLQFPLTDETWSHLHAMQDPSTPIGTFREMAINRFVQEEGIVFKHRLRDRSDVISDRNAAIKKRKHQK
ncbi:DUF309 domain-containing protein [Salinicoccus jeotgali]|uniref:DUF309 domain-containing protein n=1 Tax=Salinicoccus jeotgali TaxID=381634 RepID=A0ABP7EV55_9STAP